MEMTNSAVSTPAAEWRQAGKPDPHAGHYDCERATLTMGHLTDDELANGAFLNYDQPLNVQGILAGTHASPIAWMTAVKDRIRWLSRALEQAKAERDALAAKLAELEGQEPALYVQSNHVSCAKYSPFLGRICQQPFDGVHQTAYFARPVPAEMSPELTDTARSALLWVLWHHQGGSSPVGQPIRYALGMDAHDRLSERQVQEAKRWAALTNSETRDFRRDHAERPVNARLLEALKQAQMALIGYLPLHRNEITEAAIECACAAIADAESQAGPVRLTEAEIGVIDRQSREGIKSLMSTWPVPLARAIEDAVLERNGLKPQAKGD